MHYLGLSPGSDTTETFKLQKRYASQYFFRYRCTHHLFLYIFSDDYNINQNSGSISSIIQWLHIMNSAGKCDPNYFSQMSDNTISQVIYLMLLTTCSTMQKLQNRKIEIMLRVFGFCNNWFFEKQVWTFQLLDHKSMVLSDHISYNALLFSVNI